MLAALISTAVINDEIPQGEECSIALNCHRELTNVEPETKRGTRDATILQLSSLCFQLAARKKDTEFQTLAPHRLSVLTGLLAS